MQSLITASDVLFLRTGRDSLTTDECEAISTAHFFYINASALPALTELLDTGRMEIIQNADLLAALVELQLTREALVSTILVQSTSTTGAALPMRYPDLIHLASLHDDTLGEVMSLSECDLAGMRLNQGFLNEFSLSVDRYDAYVRGALTPWITQSDRVHVLLDLVLMLEHNSHP